MTGAPSTNFDFLAVHDAQLVRLAALAERYFVDDPNTTLIKLRQFGELLAQQVAARFRVRLLYSAQVALFWHRPGNLTVSKAGCQRWRASWTC